MDPFQNFRPDRPAEIDRRGVFVTDEDARNLVAGVVAAPFDYEPRGVLADRLDELGQGEAADRFRSGVGGYEPWGEMSGTFWRRFGMPGLVGGRRVLPTCWVGEWDEFPRACAAALFKWAPIQRVMFLDRCPLVGPTRLNAQPRNPPGPAHTFGAGRWVFQGSHAQALRREGHFPDVASTSTLVHESLGPELRAFMPLPGFRTRTVGYCPEYWEAADSLDCYTALSAAAVRLGRFAAGLPVPDSHNPPDPDWTTFPVTWQHRFFRFVTSGVRWEPEERGEWRSFPFSRMRSPAFDLSAP